MRSASVLGIPRDARMIDGRRQLQSQALAFGRSGGCRAGCRGCRFIQICNEAEWERLQRRDAKYDAEFGKDKGA